MSKRDIEVKELELKRLQERLDGLAKQITDKKALLENDKKAKSSLEECRARVTGLQASAKEQRQRLEAKREEAAKVKAQLDEETKRTAAERGGVQAVTVGQRRLNEARDSLAAVRQELVALASAAARQAALEAKGGDLPEEVAKHSPQDACAILSPPDADELWAAHDAAGEPLGVLRAMCNTSAVVIALHRALAVLAGEIRQGLRQWGFVEDACGRTQELTQTLQADMSKAAQLTDEMEAETTKLASEQLALQRDLDAMKKSNATLSSKVELLAGRLQTARQHATKLDQSSSEALQGIEDAKERHSRLIFEHEQAGIRLAVVRKALAEHAAEAERRVGAAEKLAKRAQDQANKGLEEFSQLQAQAATYQSAQGMLKQAGLSAEAQLVTERSAQESMQEEHARMHRELEALARHYLAALPPLPGLDAPLAPAPPAPRRGALPDAAPEGAHGPAGGLELAARGSPATGQGRTRLNL